MNTSGKEIFQSIFERYVKSYLAADAKACANYYAVDGQIHSPFGPPVVGRNAIESVHHEWFTEGEINKDITILEARLDGSIGYCLARYSADLPQENGSFVSESGTSLNTFERLASGEWLIRQTSLNAAQS